MEKWTKFNAEKKKYTSNPEDCYAALRWTFENAEGLNIDKTKIAVGGDSAGGALAAAVCQMAKDRGTDKPLFQFLVYPVTDSRMKTESCKKYTDTPIIINAGNYLFRDSLGIHR